MASVRGTRGATERKDTRNLKYGEFEPSSGWAEESQCHILIVNLPGFRMEDVKLQVDTSGHLTIRGERQVNENKYSSFEKTYNVPENSDIKKISGNFVGKTLYVTVPKQGIEEKKELIQEIENRTDNSIGEENKHENPSNKEESMNEDSNKHERVDYRIEEIVNEDSNKHERVDYKIEEIVNEDSNKHEGGDKKEENMNEDSNKHEGGDKKEENMNEDSNKHGDKKEENENSDESQGLHEKSIEKGGQEVSSMLGNVMKEFKNNKGIVLMAFLAFSLGVIITRKLKSCRRYAYRL